MRNHGFVYRERLGPKADGTPVTAWLAARYEHSDEATWRARITAGEVRLDGSLVDPDAPLRPGGILEWCRPGWDEPDVAATFSVLHRDEHVLAVDKPSGLPTMPGGGYLENTLLSAVRREFPGAVPAHRLGRWTSGVVLFALSEAGRAGLFRAFRERRVGKTYRALAEGRPERDDWKVDVPIGPVPHAVLGTVHGASPRGRIALSTVRVVERRNESFLADVEIETGRPHQIRIHLAASGHPLVGDPLYGPGGVPHPGCAALPGDGGYALHAAEVRIGAIGGLVPLVVTAPLPRLLRCVGDETTA